MKIALGPGTIYGAAIQEIRRLAETSEPATSLGAAQAAPITVDIGRTYLQMLQEKLQLGPRKLRVAVDCGNGTAGLFAVPFLTSLGCEVIPLYCESDGRFPHHHPDPTQSANMADLRQVVLAQQTDIGIGLDGDGDRIGVVDDTGEIIWGDQFMALFWQEILAKHPGAAAIIEVKCSQALVEEVQRLGGQLFFYKTGHSLIKAKMREIGALFAGEMSGHMFFADEYYGYDDALYAAGRLLRILSHSDQPFSRLVGAIPRYYSTAETRVPCPDEEKFQVVADLTRKFKEEYEVIDIDGARVLFPDGWGLVRCSNTQPVIVARCEGVSPEALSRICHIVQDALVAYPCTSPFTWQY